MAGLTVYSSYVHPAAIKPHAAQSNVFFGPVQVFAAVQVTYILTTYPYSDTPKFDTFDAVILSATSSRSTA